MAEHIADSCLGFTAVRTTLCLGANRQQQSQTQPALSRGADRTADRLDESENSRRLQIFCTALARTTGARGVASPGEEAESDRDCWRSACRPPQHAESETDGLNRKRKSRRCAWSQVSRPHVCRMDGAGKCRA